MRDEMSYKGNRLFCSQCKYYSKEEIINGQSIRKSCKNIDHNIIQLRPSIFGGYEESYRLTDICNYYKPKAYIKNSNYTNIDSYIYFLENDFYETPKCYKLKGLSTIRHFRTITLRILKEDLEIQVPLYDWLKGTWKIDNKIKYKSIYKLIKNKNGLYKKRKLIDYKEFNEFGWYQIKI